MPNKQELDAMGVKVLSKAGSKFMLLLGVIANLFHIDFMNRFWTTIGNTIYYPTTVKNPYHRTYQKVIEHELVHVQQWRKWNILFSVSYALFPLPVFFAWFRWRWEREAYMIQVRANPDSINWIVETLWSNYLWCWPKKWMKEWFEKEVAAEKQKEFSELL